MRKEFLLFFFFLTGFTFSGNAQETFLGINHVHLPPQIARNDIRMATRDEAGLLWFVTANGLYRYDGDDLLHFGLDTKPKLPSLAITHICTDRQGNLWIGFKNRVARFDLKHWTISTIYSKDWNLLNPRDKEVTALAYLPDGKLYVGTQSGKLFVAENKRLRQIADLGEGRRKFSPTGPALVEPSVQNIQMPVTGQIWLSTKDGQLVSINVQKNGYAKPVYYHFKESAGLSIQNICYDTSGQCLFSVDQKGLFRADIRELYRYRNHKSFKSLNFSEKEFIKPVSLPDSVQLNDYSLFFYIPGGRVALITSGKDQSKDIYIYNFPSNNWIRSATPFYNQFPGELIHSIFSGPENKVAYISSDGGLTAVFSRKLPLRVLLNRRDNINSIRAIYVTGDRLYSSSYQDYFIRYNSSTDAKKRLKILLVYRILPWAADSLLLATEGGGLYWYQPSENKFTSLGNKLSLASAKQVYQSAYVYALCRINDRLLLEGTNRGIHLIDPRRKLLYPVFSNPSSQKMQAVATNAIIPWSPLNRSVNNKYIVATGTGVFVANIRNGHTRYLLADNIPDEIRQTEVFNLIHFDGNIWMGTNGQGVLVADSSGQLLSMEWLNSKLTGQVIYSINKSGKKILLATNRGLNILNMTDSSLVSYTSADGLPSDEFNRAAYFQNEEYVYLGTTNGIVRWNKKQPKSAGLPVKNEIHINKFVIAGEKNKETTLYNLGYLPGDSIKFQIPPHTQYFSITFGKPGMEDKKYDYYYRLSSNDSWVKLGDRREITFYQMAPGDYNLQIANSLKGGKSFMNQIQIPLAKLPAFYQTLWFKGILLLIFVAVVIFIFRFREMQRNKERSLRMRIAGDLHDEVGSSLTQIWHQAQHEISQSEFVGENSPSGKGPKIKNRLNAIANTSREALSMMSDMVWSIDARYDKMEELILRMKDYVYRLKNESGVAIRIAVSGNYENKKVSQAVRQNLFLLFKEAITNAAKHGDGDRVEVNIEIGEKRLMLQVINSYNRKCTRDNNTIQGGNGLENMQRRVDKMSGQLHIKHAGDKYILIVTI